MPIIERRKGFFSQKKKEASPFNKIEDPNTLKQGENTIESPAEEPISSKKSDKSCSYFIGFIFHNGIHYFRCYDVKKSVFY